MSPQYTAHPAADLFPMLAEAELQALAEDIREHGLLHPVVMYEGQVLDGRNRLAACVLAGVEPKFTEWNGPGDPWLWVVSTNLHRRHLTTSQQAAVALALLPRLEEEAKRRQSTLNNSPPSQALPAKLREASEQAAAAVGVSARTVQTAKSIVAKAPEMLEHIRAGTLTIEQAKVLAPLPVEQRAAIATSVQSAPRAQRTRHVKLAARQAKQDAKAAEVMARPVPAADERIRIVQGDALEVLQGLAGPFDLVHADPPWEYSNQRIEGAADHHYQTSGHAGIVAALNQAYSHAAPDCYLLCWCTMPLLAEWFAASGDLRWQFKSAGAWVKTGGTSGIGFHWRGRAEVLLLYVKGAPRPIGLVQNAHVSRVQEHSEKPVEWLDQLVAVLSPRGGTVLDVYAGLGPMARACSAQGRRYLGIELDEARRRQALELVHHA